MSASRIVRILTGLGLTVALSVGAAGVANAANQDGVQNSGELIYYYNSGLAGAWSDFSGSVLNLAGYSYIGGGSASNGFGTPVKNNAASVKNLDANWVAYVHYNSNFGGSAFRVPKLWSGNLDAALKNQNASHRWASN